MGILLKSIIGLGSVYFLMFGPTAERPTLGPVATLCGQAAAVRAHGADTLASEAQTARCLMALGVVAAPLHLTQAENLAPPPPPPPPHPVRRGGGLTDSDLSEPWLGPGSLSRKSPRRG